MKKATNSKQVFSTALIWSLWLMLSIGAIGGGLSLLLNGVSGFFSALVGASISAAFSILTLLALVFGSKLPLGGFYAVVMGGWLLKILVFLGVIAFLNGQTWLHRPTVFFAIVATVLGGLAIDAVIVLRSRVPVVETP
ncbi:MAG: hypothetical protein RLZZ400_820 [Actinomycetota bacterium]